LGAEEFQKMKGLVTPPVFMYLDPADPKGDHPVGLQGKIQGIAVYIHYSIEGKPSLNFLDISLGKNDKIFVQKHRPIIPGSFFLYKPYLHLRF
jgi:hypothetical protein